MHSGPDAFLSLHRSGNSTGSGRARLLRFLLATRGGGRLAGLVLVLLFGSVAVGASAATIPAERGSALALIGDRLVGADGRLRIPPALRGRSFLHILDDGPAAGAAGCLRRSGIVDVIPAHKGDELWAEIIHFETYDEDVYFQTFSDAPGIVVPVDPDNGTRNPRVRLPKGSLVTERFRILSHEVGAANVHVVPLFDGVDVLIMPFGIWEFQGAFDFAGLWDSYWACADPENPSQPHPDPLVRRLCGDDTPARAIAADGTSRLLLRVRSPLDGKACYRVISDGPPDPGTTDPGDDLVADLIDGDYWLYGGYLAPSEFDDPAAVSRTVQLEVVFWPKDQYGGYVYSGTSGYTTTIEIRRPPVVLLHGLWGDAGTFDGAFETPEPAGGWMVSTGEYPNSAHFSRVQGEVGKVLRAALDDARKRERMATSKVDVIAHSMGSLVLRNWMLDPDYRRLDNLGAGDVRRLVSLDSPHAGSQFANMLINVHNNFSHLPLSSLWYLERLLPGDIHRGAICDLAQNSPAMAFPGVGDVYAHAFAGAGGVVGDLSGLFGGVVKSFFLFPDQVVHLQPYYFLDLNDGIVSVDSQHSLGGIPVTLDDTLVHTDFLGGTAVTASVATAQDAYRRLDAAGGFGLGLPAVTSSGDGVPRPPVGRGADIDAANYAVQCAAGGPMDQPAAARAVEPAAAGINIVSPVPGQVFAPGDVVDFVAEVDPLLQAGAGTVLASLDSGIDPLDLPGVPYSGQIPLPSDLTGPVDLVFAVQDQGGNYLDSALVTVEVVPGDPPLWLESLTGNVNIDLSWSSSPTEQLRIRGHYDGGIVRDLTSSVTGTVYRSLDGSVATVDGEGLVTAVGTGRTVIEVRHLGVQAWVEVDVHDPATPLSDIDQTAAVVIEGGGFRRDRKTGRIVQRVTVRNQSQEALPSPLQLIVSDLPSGVSVMNADGVTRRVVPVGAPYIRLEQDGPLVPGGEAATTLEFETLEGRGVEYTARVFSSYRP